MIVNTTYIDKFNPSEKMIILTNGESIDCSRRGGKIFKDYLDIQESQAGIQAEGGLQTILDKFTSFFKS